MCRHNSCESVDLEKILETEKSRKGSVRDGSRKCGSFMEIGIKSIEVGVLYMQNKETINVLKKELGAWSQIKLN